MWDFFNNNNNNNNTLFVQNVTRCYKSYKMLQDCTITYKILIK